MRIITGFLKGREVPLPDPKIARPTSDKIRQSLFNILEHRYLSRPWSELRVLDAFAGSGLLGLEAISRGAKECIFLEKNRHLAQTLQKTIRSFQLSHAIVEHQDFFMYPEHQKFDLIFLDPPFTENLWDRAVDKAQKISKGIIYIEASKTLHLERADIRKHGSIIMHFIE